jgi:hypothetical protein
MIKNQRHMRQGKKNSRGKSSHDKALMIKDTGHPRHDCNNSTATKEKPHKDSQDTKAVTGQNKNAMLRRITSQLGK